MKKLLLLVAAAACSFSLQGQITTPQPSPFSKIHQVVGLTDVSVEYSRPSMRGRTIFGDLVPFDKIWRTGANARTKITFSDDVTIGETTLKAGTYAIFTKPGQSSWDVYFYTETGGGGTPSSWDDSKVAAQLNVPVYAMAEDVETFTISIDNLNNNGATLGMIWENTYVGVPFNVPTKAKASRSIEAVMGGPSGNDYFSAALYYLQEDMDLNKAKMWIDKAVSMNDKAFWMSRQQSLIYAKLGDKDGAIKAAKKSLADAKAANNADYVKMNMDSLKEWGAM
jgi:tetratricopeptide (TPR) repeat protein